MLSCFPSLQRLHVYCTSSVLFSLPWFHYSVGSHFPCFPLLSRSSVLLYYWFCPRFNLLFTSLVALPFLFCFHGSSSLFRGILLLPLTSSFPGICLFCASEPFRYFSILHARASVLFRYSYILALFAVTVHHSMLSVTRSFPCYSVLSRALLLLLRFVSRSLVSAWLLSVVRCFHTFFLPISLVFVS